jgi:tyrosinase
MADYVRRDIWGLSDEDEWHPIIRAYALGVAALQDIPPARPTSWVYQAAVHSLPPGQEGDDFINQCQHNCWFFLPWHRLYLYYFERIVRAAVVAHRDIDDATKRDWALPYWNYEGGARTLSLPPAFRSKALANGTTRNALYVKQRNPGRNDGDPVDPTEATSEDARSEGSFSLDRPAGGFGGAATGWNHYDEDPNLFPGVLERTPHGSIHGAVGGYMGKFETAGLDPVFWLHHCNIDRLWELWRGQPDASGNPDPGSAWGKMEFQFHDEEEKPV